jgi:hypothetical protein
MMITLYEFTKEFQELEVLGLLEILVSRTLPAKPGRRTLISYGIVASRVQLAYQPERMNSARLVEITITTAKQFLRFVVDHEAVCSVSQRYQVAV